MPATAWWPCARTRPRATACPASPYWTEEAAALIREELDKSGPDDYWEDAVIRILDRVPVYATRVKMLLCEIDSLSDALSLGLLTPDELADQCSETQMAEKAQGPDQRYLPHPAGRQGLVLRIPGQGTDQIIDRSVEAAMLEMVKDRTSRPNATSTRAASRPRTSWKATAS